MRVAVSASVSVASSGLFVCLLVCLAACSKDEPKPGPTSGAVPSALAADSGAAPLAPASVTAIASAVPDASAVTADNADAAPPVFPDDPRTKGWAAYEAPDRLYAAKFPKAPKAERKDGVPTFVSARFETAKFPQGDMYYVTAMIGREQEPPPSEIAQQLLDMVLKRGFQSLEMQATKLKDFTDPFGNPGRDVTVVHQPSKRDGVGRVVLNRKTGIFLITVGFGPQSAPFIDSSHFLK